MREQKVQCSARRAGLQRYAGRAMYKGNEENGSERCRVAAHIRSQHMIEIRWRAVAGVRLQHLGKGRVAGSAPHTARL